VIWILEHWCLWTFFLSFFLYLRTHLIAIAWTVHVYEVRCLNVFFLALTFASFCERWCGSGCWTELDLHYSYAR